MLNCQRSNQVNMCKTSDNCSGSFSGPFCKRLRMHWAVVLLYCTCMVVQQSTFAASKPLELASAVLQHVANTPVTVTSGGRQARITDSKPSKGSTLADVVTVLPTPPAPPAWTQFVRDVQEHGSRAVVAHVGKEQCILPDIQGSTAAHCQLGRRPWAYRFKQQQSSAYVAALFHSILAGRAATTRQLGAPAPVLSRFDLFHGHIFLAPRQGANSSIGNNNGSSNTHQGGTTAQAMPPRGRAQRRMLCGTNSGAAARILQDSRVASTAAGSADVGVGILFHAAEYPAFSPSFFPINLGHCQANSTCSYHLRAMDLRNLLWWQGRLAVLDVGIDSPLHALLHEGTEPLRTLYEEDFGTPIADLLMLQEPKPRRRRSLQAAQQQEQRSWFRLLASGQALAACHASQLGVFVSY